MSDHTKGPKLPSRPAPNVPPPLPKKCSKLQQTGRQPLDPFSPLRDDTRDKRKVPPRPPPPRLNLQQSSSHIRSIFSSKRNPKKGAATAIVKPLPPSNMPNIPTGTLIDLGSPPSSPKSQKDKIDNIWSSLGGSMVKSSTMESGFEDDFNSLVSSTASTPSMDIWSDFSNNSNRKKESFVTRAVKPLPPPVTSTVTSKPTIICVKQAKPERPPPPKLEVSSSSPPMPNIPPPPPPPDLYQLLSNGPEIPTRPNLPYQPDDDSGPPVCTAMYDYISSHPGDLIFKAGDVIAILNQESEEWYRGRLNGNEGIFPVSYVSEKRTGKKQPFMKVLAIFKYNPSSWDDLEFEEGETIFVLDRVNNDWLYGECCGRTGIFPECYVQDIWQYENLQ